MSHITSVRFVNLTVHSSQYAQVLNGTLLFALTWAIVLLSHAPLVISIYLLLLIIKAQRCGGFIAPSSQGNWHVHRNGIVRQDESTSFITSTDLSVPGIKVTFVLASKDSITIWRDSCHDVKYRQLCLILHQWKMGAEAPE
ncbi:protein YgfX [Vibrio sp. B1REV9]|uniref:protein YgfX n=1 Tax=Vibrio sp. B1REV9 TaxID=2751179 RepID=UPI00398C816D